MLDDLIKAFKLASPPQTEEEGADYGACRFTLNDQRVVFRVAKKTPTKIGMFVTLWKRSDLGGPIQPLDVSDEFDLVIIATRDQNNSGYFAFTKDVLAAKGVLSSGSIGGKRAIR